MHYTILVERHDDGTYEASVPAMPQLAERGESRAAAVAAIGRAIRAMLRDVELLDLEIPAPPAANVWLETAGMFADDPDLEAITEEIYAARCRQGRMSAGTLAFIARFAAVGPESIATTVVTLEE